MSKTVLSLTAAPEIREVLPAARAALLNYFHRPWHDELNEIPFIAARWKFHLRGVRESHMGYDYDFDIDPLGGRMVPGPYRSIVAHHRTHAGGLKRIPENDALAYRGMAWEEWQYIRKNCLVKSRGAYNMGQSDLTFFGSASQAMSYASGFAPFAFVPTVKYPSVVIAIDRSMTLSQRDAPDMIPDSERAIRGGLSARLIREVWYATPTQTTRGELRIHVYRDGETLRHGERGALQTPLVRVAVHRADDAPLRRACP